MMNKYELFSKGWWKEFYKQTPEDQKKITGLIITEKMNAALLKVSTNATLGGMYCKGDMLYRDYVQKLDEVESRSEEWFGIVDKLLSDLRVCHIKYEQYKAQEAKKSEGENNRED